MWLPDYDPQTGLLPPGRYALTLSHAEESFVKNSRFVTSGTRSPIWTEWAEHRYTLCAIAGRVTTAWVSGSFASTKHQPGDIDVTYLIEADHYDELEDDDREILAELCDASWCRENGWRVDAHLIPVYRDLPYWRLETTRSMSEQQRKAFFTQGIYDEVWQRMKPAAGVPATGRRGYVEVTW